MDRAKLSAQPSLYKRGERFYAKIKHADGRWTNHNTGQQVRQHALVAAEEMQARVDRGLPAVDKPDASGTAHTPVALLTLRELAARFLAEYHGRVKDLDKYKKTARHDLRYLVDPYLGDVRASMLRRSDVKAWLARLRGEGYAGNTINCAMARLSAIYTWAIDEEVLAMVHPCARIPRERTSPTEICHSLQQVGRLLALADRPTLDVNAVMVVAALYTGMRRGELRALRWAWVDLDELVIHVRASYGGLPKNGKARTIPLHKELLPWLKRWQEQCPATPEGLLFPVPAFTRGKGPGGQMRCGWRMEDIATDRAELDEVYKQAQIDRPLRPWHALRHTFSTHLSKATRGNNDVVSKILGHAGAGCATTLGYIHSADLDYLAAELNRLSYVPRPAADVLDLQQERDRRRQQAQQEVEAEAGATPLATASVGYVQKSARKAGL